MDYRILVISADVDDVRALGQALDKALDGPFPVEHATSLAAGLERLRHSGIGAVLVDLSLPDSKGLKGFDELYKAVRHIPILTLCTIDDERDAKEAVQRGAQGWLSKGYYDNNLVPQSLRNIIERMKVEQGLYVAQKRAQITLNSIGDAVIATDMLGNVDFLNIVAEKITGWSREEARGRAIGDVLSIAVNVSAVEFRHREFSEYLHKIFEETGADPSCLQFELTESVLMRDVSNSADMLSKLKSIGVQIAVDDFGTGYSSLSYLTRLPIDILKIDQSFVKAIKEGSGGPIVSAVIDMGKNLQQRVIAEGIEEEEQFALLKSRNCNEGQGYWFSHPVDAGRMQAMLGAGMVA